MCFLPSLYVSLSPEVQLSVNIRQFVLMADNSHSVSPIVAVPASFEESLASTVYDIF
jgi:hypothetical protein